ncbi:hypothetical protein K0M31_005965 [Melipona bicolor]|uniref:Uncharacterized protein n=1 Tax=Melipona bicolor TaxID=60889 RepID=A0AA40FSK0_9HYME|nr:hypothetical protein K0M31_005965 [Melipona bicolor]
MEKVRRPKEKVRCTTCYFFPVEVTAGKQAGRQARKRTAREAGRQPGRTDSWERTEDKKNPKKVPEKLRGIKTWGRTKRMLKDPNRRKYQLAYIHERVSLLNFEIKAINDRDFWIGQLENPTIVAADSLDVGIGVIRRVKPSTGRWRCEFVSNTFRKRVPSLPEITNSNTAALKFRWNFAIRRRNQQTVESEYEIVEERGRFETWRGTRRLEWGFCRPLGEERSTVAGLKEAGGATNRGKRTRDV